MLQFAWGILKESRQVASAFVLVLLGVLLVGLLSLVVCLLFKSDRPASSLAAGLDRENLGGLPRDFAPENLDADLQLRKGAWVGNGPVRDRQLLNFAKSHKSIGFMVLNQAEVTGEGLAALAGHGLRKLELRDMDITVGMAEGISKISELESLQLNDQSVDDNVVSALTGPRSLAELGFRHSRVTAAGLRTICRTYPHLLDVSLVDCKNIDDKALRVFESQKQLKGLTVMYCPVTASSIVALVDALPVERIHIYQAGAVGQFLAGVKSRRLSKINLPGVVLKEKEVEILSRMKNLKNLVLDRPAGASKAQLDALQARLPHCTLELVVEPEKPEVGLVD
ncbi:MAG: hypothetical protein SFV17_15445 [Candidatus Obscuribacter sp.]|nr:hypothetical protein [Candidatus Obscuribacter sp.]